MNDSDLINPVYCPQCRRAIPQDAGHCPHCGAAVTWQTRRREIEQVAREDRERLLREREEAQRRRAEDARQLGQENHQQGPEERQQPQLFQCPDCGHEVSHRADLCPDCGHVFRPWNTSAGRSIFNWAWGSCFVVFFLFLVLIILLMFARVAGGP